MISEDDVNAFAAKRLRLARHEAGLSQGALGAMVGVTFQQVQKYEWNINRMSVGRCMQFADAFDMAVSEFFPVRDRYSDEPLPPAAFKILRLLTKIDPKLHDLAFDTLKSFAKASKG